MIGWILWFHEHQELVYLGKLEEGLHKVGNFTLAEISEKVGSEPVMAFFPTEWVSFVETQFPKTSEKKLRLALPALVEEAIASPPEDNFYALSSEYHPGELNTLAVIAKNECEKILQACEQANVSLNLLAPDCFLLPAPTQGLSKLEQDDRLLVRTGPLQGFALHKEHAVLIMQELDALVSVEPSLSELPPFNFLQGPYAVKAPKQRFGIEHTIYLALGGAVVLHLISLMIIGSVLNHRLALLQDKSLALYAEVFPGAKKVSSAKVMIERELKSKGGLAFDPFEGLVLSLSEALAQAPGAGLGRLEYHQNQLSAHLSLPNLDGLDKLTQAFEGKQIQAKPEQITEENNTVSVQLSLSPGEAK